MSIGLNNLRTRLNYQGGETAESRFQLDKLKSLKKALLYSYQAETAVIDGKMFRCLLNPNKEKADYDCKIISIPYADICLGKYDEETKEKIIKKPDGKTNQNFIPTGIEAGKVFLWEETNSHWLVYLQFLQEDAYFRGEVYRCEEEPVEINGHQYYVYIRGPVETTIQWRQKKSINWNDLNYSLIMYITKNEETLDYFHRFNKIKIGKDMWEIKTVDPYSADGIIEVCLGEWFNNEYAEAPVEESTDIDESAIDQTLPRIEGPKIVKPFDTVSFSIVGLSNGDWIIDDNRKAKFIKSENNIITIEIITGKSGSFTLSYKVENNGVPQYVHFPIVIESL